MRSPRATWSLQQSAKQDQTRAAGTWLVRRDRQLRAEGGRSGRPRSSSIAPRPTCSSATTTRRCRTSSSAISTAQLASARAPKADAEAKARIIREALKSGRAGRVLRHHQFRADAAAVGAARHACARSSPSSPRRCSTSIPASRNCARRSAISNGRCARRPTGWRVRWRTTPSSQATRSRRSAPSLDQLKRQAASTNEQDVQLRALERDAKSQRDLLESYLAKYREATARDSIGAASPDARIISTAVVSNTPSWPKKLPTVLVAALAMFALSAGFVLTRRIARRAAHAGHAADAGEPAAAARPQPPRPRREALAVHSRHEGRGRPGRAQIEASARRRRRAVEAVEALAASSALPARRPADHRDRRRCATWARPWRPSRLRAALRKQARVGAGRSGLGARPTCRSSPAIRPAPGHRRTGARIGLVRPDHHARPLFARPPDHGRPSRDGRGRGHELATAVDHARGARRAATITWWSMPARSRTLRSNGSPIWRRGRCWWRASSMIQHGVGARASAQCRLCRCERAGQRAARPAIGATARSEPQLSESRQQMAFVATRYSPFATLARSRRSACTAAHRAGFSLITRLVANAARKAWAASRPRARERVEGSNSGSGSLQKKDL